MVKGKYLTRLASSVMDRQLLHALGCDERLATLRSGVMWFTPCRNSYVTAFYEDALEEAVDNGYAICLDGVEQKGSVVYSVTVKGISYLAEKYKVRIAINRAVTDPLVGNKGKEKAA